MASTDAQQSDHQPPQASLSVAARAKFIFVEAACFALFVFAYFLPLLLDMTGALIQSPTIALLTKDLLATPTAQVEITRNVFGQLLPLLFVYWLATQLAGELALYFKINRGLVRFLWLLAIWALLVSGNALVFPKSNYSFGFFALTKPFIAYCLAALLASCSLWLAIRTWTWRHCLFTSGVAAAFFFANIATNTAVSSPSSSGKNIIFIGVDSLSAAAWSKLHDQLPHLNDLLASSTQYTRAYTPLGRTFPAWMSILSGKAPAEHGAICNLRNLNQVEQRDLLSVDLQNRGYRTVYAIDERRFNNINESFGFDRIVGPEAGALDFVIQRLNDTPLSNALLQTSAGRAFMPYSYVNTASYPNYDADKFVDLVLESTAGAPKLFLAVHFESAHFPFKTRHAEVSFTSSNEFWNRHAAALTVVDKQVGRLLEGLSAQGFLQDALVVVLSDHGEGLGEIEGTITMEGVPDNISSYGHGGSIVSDHQNRIILGTVSYKNGRPENRYRSIDEQVSLADIRPMVSTLLDTGSSHIQATEQCMTIETGFRAAAAADYKTLDEASLAASTANYYEIDSRGRMRFREDRLEELVNSKDIGIRCPDHITWWSDARSAYFSFQLTAQGGYSIEQAPPKEEIDRIEAYRQRLLTAAKRSDS